MYYKLTNLEKLKQKETFDRNSLVGADFFVEKMPIIGEKFYAIHDGKCLITTEVLGICRGGDWFSVETKNTKYEFEVIK